MTSLARPVGMATVIENLLKRRWSAVILRYIAGGSHTAEEIIQAEPDLTILVLNERIRAMVRYKLITRAPRRSNNLTVGYGLTQRGRKILCLLDLIDQLDDLELGHAFAAPRLGLRGLAPSPFANQSPLPAQPALPAPAPHQQENNAAPPFACTELRSMRS